MESKKPAQKNSQDPELRHLSLDTANAVSSTDLTGLIPANPQLHEELASYKEIYDLGNDILNKDKTEKKKSGGRKS